MSQGSGGAKEWIELLVVDDNVDMRGWELGDNDDGSWSSIGTFSSNAAWQSVSKGTIIVVYNAGDVDPALPSADYDFADNSVIIAGNNATYFSSWSTGSGKFGNSDDDDCAAIRNSSGTMIHDMAVTHPSATIDAPSSAKATGFIGGGLTDLATPAKWSEVASGSATPGQPNGGDNTTWVSSLRSGGGGNDTDTDVTQETTVAGGTISSLVDTEGEAVDVLTIAIWDWGTADGLATNVTNIRLKPHTSNTADWTNNIIGATLNNGSPIAVQSVAVDDSYLDIAIASGDLAIPDNDVIEVTIGIYLSNAGTVEDGQVLSFMVDADDHGFTADASGSDFAAAFSGDFNSNDYTIEATATELQFGQQPTTTPPNVAMSPAVTVKATDANGNTDTDFSADIRITSSGSLQSSPVVIPSVTGVATFTSLTHTAEGSGLTLTAQRDATTDWDVASSSFDIASAPAIVITEIAGKGHNGDYNDEYIELTNTGSSTVDITDWNIEYYESSIEADLTLSGTIAAGGTYIVAVRTTYSGISPDYVPGTGFHINNSFYAILKDDGGTTIDEAGSSSDKFNDANNYEFTDCAGDNSPVANWTNLGTSNGTPGTNNCTPTCSTPTSEATNMTFSSVAGTQMDVDFTAGDGENRLLVVREGNPVSFTPTDNVTYTANADYSAGSEVGPAGEGNKVVYNGDGTGLPITVNGLTGNTLYHFAVYEYSCSAGSERYLTGSPLTGNQGTINYIAIDAITGAHFCVTASQSDAVTVDFTYSAAGDFTGTFTAQLSDNVGDFSSPVTIGTVASDQSGNQSISGTIPAATADGIGYRIRVICNTPSITGSDNGSDLTVNLFPVEVGALVASSGDDTESTVSWNNPSSCFDQVMLVAKEGSAVTATPTGDGSAYTADLVFGSGTSFDGGYVLYKGTTSGQTISNLTNDTEYHFTVFTRKGSEWSLGATTTATPASITKFKPGELIIVGYDASVGGSTDKIYLTNLIPINTNTKFLYANSRFEAGAAANVRTNRWYGGGDDPYQPPGLVEFTWSGSSALPVGTIISFEIGLGSPSNIRIDDVATSDLTGQQVTGYNVCNISASDGDQVWLMQGEFTSYGTAGTDMYHTFDGTVLYGLTNKADWVPITSACSGGSSPRESRLHPNLECFNTEFGGSGQGYNYYKNESLHNGSKNELLVAIMTPANWVSGSGDNSLNFTEDFTSPYTNLAIGKPFTITAGNIDGYWLGSTDNDWFDCSNWEGRAVPDSTTDVIIEASASNDMRIDISASANSGKFDDVAKCKNLTINGRAVILEAAQDDTLKVFGDLYIAADGQLDMDDGTATTDGQFYLYGNWDNQSGAADFLHGDGTVHFMGTGRQTITHAANQFELFNDVNIGSDAVLTIPYNAGITIGGTLDNQGELHLTGATNSSASGSLITQQSGSTIAGSATVERFIPMDEWHYLTIPVSTASSNLFVDPKYNTGSVYNPMFYRYDETYDGPNSNDWDDYGGAWSRIGYDQSLTPGTGYITRFNEYHTYKFSGQLNNGDTNIPLTFTDNDDDATNHKDGWNMIGNPFPSAIDWDAVSPVNIDNVIYFYEDDHTTGIETYHSYGGGIVFGDGSSLPSVSTGSGSRYIPAMQAFFVHATSAGNLTLPNAARVHNNQVFFKTAAKTPDNFLRLTAEVNEVSDDLVIRFFDKATTDYDGMFDGFKRFSRTKYLPQIYSYTYDAEVALSINTLPEVYDGLSIPLGLQLGQESTCTISAQECQFEGFDVYLWDKDKKQHSLLSVNESYTFTANTGNDADRFEIQFKKACVGIEEMNFDQHINIYAARQTVFINISQSINTVAGQAIISDLAGRTVAVQPIEQAGLHRFEIDVPPGVYIVKLNTVQGSKTQKIILQ